MICEEKTRDFRLNGSFAKMKTRDLWLKWGIIEEETRDFRVKWGIFEEKTRNFWFKQLFLKRICVIFSLNQGYLHRENV